MRGVNTQQVRANISDSVEHGSARIADAYTQLPREALIREVSRAAAGDERAFERVLLGMSRMIMREAVKYYRLWAPVMSPSASFCDAFAGGLAGLRKAVQDYDPGSGNAFTTYAEWKIRAGVQEEIYKMCGAMHLPRKILSGGALLDVASPLAASSVLSLEYTRQDVDDDLLEHVGGDDPALEAVESIGAAAELVQMLRGIDERMPELVQWLARDYAYREIARLMRMRIKDVERLHTAAQAALLAAGVSLKPASTAALAPADHPAT